MEMQLVIIIDSVNSENVLFDLLYSWYCLVTVQFLEKNCVVEWRVPAAKKKSVKKWEL